jgi:hypothetical protein
MEEAGSLDLFSPSEVVAVRDAYVAAHDISVARYIPSITLIKTRAVLEAAGTLPDIWYMGDKAISRFSGKKYSALVKLVRAVFKKQTLVDGIDEDDLKTLTSKLSSLVQSFPSFSGEDSEESDEDPLETFSSKKKRTKGVNLRSILESRERLRREHEKKSAGVSDWRTDSEEDEGTAKSGSYGVVQTEGLGAGEDEADFKDATSGVGPTADV